MDQQEMTSRFTKLFNATAAGRMPVYHLDRGETFILTREEYLKMSVGEILEGLESKRFRCNGEII